MFCYEPSPVLLEEAKQNLSGFKNVVFLPSLRRLKYRRFSYVFCLEVFEHLPRRETVHSIRRSIACWGGKAPWSWGANELFIPALIKGLFRMTRRYGSFDARPGNVLRAVLGRPPKRRPVREITPGLPYHFHHTGFDHRKLRIKLSETFEIARQFASPVGGVLLGTEIYFILRKRDRSAWHPERGSTSSR